MIWERNNDWKWTLLLDGRDLTYLTVQKIPEQDRWSWNFWGPNGWLRGSFPVFLTAADAMNAAVEAVVVDE